MRPRLPTAPIAALAAAALLLCGCATGGAAADGGTTPGSGTADRGTAVVQFSAASSLTDLAPELTAAYARQTGDRTPIQVNLGASSKLVQQANAGQQPDLLITADTEAPQALQQPGGFEAPVELAANHLVLVVPADSPITRADQLAGAGPVALCAPAVPCGRTAHAYLEQAGLTLDTASEEADVRSVLTKVTAGQVDAGFVYATDAAAAGDAVRVIALPGVAPNVYPLLVATDASAPARDFAHWLQGDAAARLFRAAGFTRP
ncbi:molybdate ABC transporter substrate-binding protein [Arthrobacter sp. JSM 101049]|uniref:molybdate ABC transporter substrate-binding protein n=1 Tax=Arthrobacter sp. JSM 101049 TaxID=929097 RepID=UPI00356A0842